MNSEKKTWRDLIVWQKSHQLVLLIHNLIKAYPVEERFALTDQTRRSALSVPTNIVEGQSRNSKKDFIRFLIISRGSLEELRYLLLVAADLKSGCESCCNELKRSIREGEEKFAYGFYLLGVVASENVENMESLAGIDPLDKDDTGKFLIWFNMTDRATDPKYRLEQAIIVANAII